MTFRGQFGQLLAPGLSAIMFDWLKEHPEEFSQFLNVETTENAWDDEQFMAGFGLARRKPENEPITYDDPIQGPSKRFISDPYALGWMVSRETLDDEKYGVMRKMPGEMIKSSRQTWEQLGANVLNGGFTVTTVHDGLPLFHTAHPLLGGGTFSNRLDPDADISVTAIQDILLMGENAVNDRGLLGRMELKYLWIPSFLQFIAAEVLQSQYQPYSGENTINTVHGRLEPRILHFLTSQRAWFVTGEISDTELKFKWRKKIVADSADDFDTKGVKHSIYFRCVAGASHWKNAFGSNP
jgi:hypothetical protein